jgi:hypothetical protein
MMAVKVASVDHIENALTEKELVTFVDICLNFNESPINCSTASLTPHQIRLPSQEKYPEWAQISTLR